jgi:hypothetical protein
MKSLILAIILYVLYVNYIGDEKFVVHLPVNKYTPQGYNQPTYNATPPSTRTKPYGMFLFENTEFKPECCPFSSYSSSRGCPCSLPRVFFD